MPNVDPWLTEREAALELRVSPQTIRAERGAGKLGYAKVRRRVFYPMSAIDAYRAAAQCPASPISGSIPSPGTGTSPGQRPEVVRDALQRAREIVEKRRLFAQRSS